MVGRPSSFRLWRRRERKRKASVSEDQHQEGERERETRVKKALDAHPSPFLPTFDNVAVSEKARNFEVITRGGYYEQIPFP